MARNHGAKSDFFPKKKKGLLLGFRKPFSFRIGCGRPQRTQNSINSLSIRDPKSVGSMILLPGLSMDGRTLISHWRALRQSESCTSGMRLDVRDRRSVVSVSGDAGNLENRLTSCSFSFPA